MICTNYPTVGGCSGLNATVVHKFIIFTILSRFNNYVGSVKGSNKLIVSQTMVDNI